MKRYITLLFLSTLIVSCDTKNHTEIENLKNNDEIIKFLVTNIDSTYSKEELFPEKSEDNFKELINKKDLDNNGLTDLVIECPDNRLIIILDKGGNRFKELNLYYGTNNYKYNYQKEYLRLKTFDSISDYPIIIVATEQMNSKVIEYYRSNDTLVVKNDRLLEFNNSKGKIKHVKLIEFETSYCYGNCPVFKINLERNGALIYNGIEYTNFEGEKNIVLVPDKLTDLISLVEYSILYKLKDSYSVGHNHDQTATLTVTYQDGSSKTIEDYGILGTRNLQYIYHEMFEISNNIK